MVCHAFFRRRLLGDLAPALRRTVHRVGERLDHQCFPGIEMRVEPAMGEAGVLHQVGDADAMGALLAQPHRSPLHDPRVSFELVFPGITHPPCLR